MERNSIFPETHLFQPLERLKQVGRFIGRVLTPFPEDAHDYRSNHFKPRGAAEMLDSYLDCPDFVEPPEQQAFRFDGHGEFTSRREV